MRTRALLVAVGLLAATLTGPRATAATWVDDVKDATRDFRSVAKADGYGKFKDADGGSHGDRARRGHREQEAESGALHDPSLTS